MPRIDFYILPEQAPNGRPALACRLTEKAYGQNHKVYIQAASAEQARLLDDLLWTFRQGSFIPHALCPPDDTDLPPVLIGWEDSPALAARLFRASSPTINPDNQPAADELVAGTVLINLSPDVPAAFERFERVAELVDQEPQTLAKSRERFRYYREHGYTPASHKLPGQS